MSESCVPTNIVVSAESRTHNPGDSTTHALAGTSEQYCEECGLFAIYWPSLPMCPAEDAVDTSDMVAIEDSMEDNTEDLVN